MSEFEMTPETVAARRGVVDAVLRRVSAEDADESSPHYAAGIEHGDDLIDEAARVLVATLGESGRGLRALAACEALIVERLHGPGVDDVLRQVRAVPGFRPQAGGGS